MARRINLGDDVNPVKKIFLPGRLKNMDKELLKRISTKQVALDMVEIFRSAVNPYIPVSSGAIRDEGYIIQLSNSKKEPWGKLIYRNTKALPYVMYQYEGKIWRPNFAVFDLQVEKFDKRVTKLRNVNIQAKHIGWAVSKNHPRHKTALNFRRKKQTKMIKLYGNIKCKLTMYGYRNKDAQPRWVEYTARKDPNWRNNINLYAEKVYSRAIEQIAADKQAKALRASANGKMSRDAAEILGFKAGTRITTRLRKKNGGI